MSAISDPAVPGPDGQWTTASANDSLGSRIEGWLARLSEYLNPILVKESRQALKSRQFVVTFLLVLLAAWFWTTLALAILGPEADYTPAGPMLFTGYYLILAFPLLVIVPFSAYRSLSAEWEERTFELLSITNLSAYQIVSGKLASATAQVVVYLSAVAPCLAFTYLLRGIDLLSIALMLGWLLVASFGLCVSGLYMATTAPDKYRQMAQQIAVVIGLLAAFWACAGFTVSVFNDWMLPLEDAAFWQANLAVLMAAVSFYVLGYQAAAAGLNFPSSNRSTPLRITAIVQHSLFTGWIAWAWAQWSEFPILLVYLVVSGGYWFAAGSYMTGEPAVMSPRVKRDLPQSVLGRTFLTWLNPGPGTGYLLALVGYGSTLLFALLLLQVQLWSGRPIRSVGPTAMADPVELVLRVGVGVLVYLAFYLGVGKWLLAVAARAQPIGVNGRALLHSLLVAAGVAGPLIFQWSSVHRGEAYTLWQTTNPFWTIWMLCYPASSDDPLVALCIMSILAALVLAWQLPSIGREVASVRLAPPPRVAEEDAATAAALAPPPEPKDPWDESIAVPPA